MRLNQFLVLAACVTLCVGPALAATESSDQAAPSAQDRLTSAPSYMPMPTLSAGVIQRYSTAGTIVVDMGLDVPNEALRHHAFAIAPRLHDALRTALSNCANIYYRDRTEPDPATLTRLMQQGIDQTLGAPGAQVLLVNIIYQRRQGT